VNTVFVDTNVLLYSVDDHEPTKQKRSTQWLEACWAGQCGRISVQVLNEFYANARRKFSRVVSTGEARDEVRRYQQWRPWVIDHATVETAWNIESRYRLSYWDALVIAAAQHQGAAILLTEDLQHDQRIDGIRIVNPFLVGPELIGAAA